MKVINPLAQSFYVDNDAGVFVTSIDLYFVSKDPVLPVTVQLRPMELGLPTQKVYPFSEVVIPSRNVIVSDDASIPTRVVFPSPVYLIGKKFHAIVVLANLPTYSLWVSRLNEVDVTTLAGPESKQLLVTKQPLSGGLFKSQNGETWTESGYEDLKFSLYRADFTSFTGDINFYNSELTRSNDQIARLRNNPLEFTSKRIRVGLGTTVSDVNLKRGNTIVQQGSNAYGNYVDSAGIATGSLTIINPGIGYTPSSGSQLYTGIALTSITGEGKNGTVNITVTDGVAIAATISNGGTGYSDGDIVSISQLGSDDIGINLLMSIVNLSGINELIIDNVQGDFVTGVGKTVQYVNSIGIRTDLNGGGVLILDGEIETETDGLHIKVNHRNHAMHAEENNVVIRDVITNVKPVKLLQNYGASETGSISLDSTISFTTFENVGISSTNPGYIMIGNEIIAYEGISQNSLTGITRQIDQTRNFSYTSGTPVYKYELNGISLRRINKSHTLQDATITDSIDFDYYNLKIDTSSAGNTSILPQGQVDRSVGTSFPKLFSNETRLLGGNKITATQNIQFESMMPVIQTMTLNGTDVAARVRTVSGTSVDGLEFSFYDQGFDEISLNKTNHFETPRLVCSRVNEEQFLATSNEFFGEKSLTLNLFLETSSRFISPVIDLDRASMIFITNRINNPILDYAADDRVSNLKDDPSAFVYATNPVSLEIPATSLKVLVTAYVNEYSDLRCLYAIKNDPNEELIYYPFPGYSNKNDADLDLYRATSDGTTDEKIAKSDILAFNSKELKFKEYEFTVSNLPSFKFTSIKLIGAGTNQAYPPRLRDLRVICLA
jgi:hypothetical protein